MGTNDEPFAGPVPLSAGLGVVGAAVRADSPTYASAGRSSPRLSLHFPRFREQCSPVTTLSERSGRKGVSTTSADSARASRYCPRCTNKKISCEVWLSAGKMLTANTTRTIQGCFRATPNQRAPPSDRLNLRLVSAAGLLWWQYDRLEDSSPVRLTCALSC